MMESRGNFAGRVQSDFASHSPSRTVGVEYAAVIDWLSKRTETTEEIKRTAMKHATSYDSSLRNWRRQRRLNRATGAIGKGSFGAAIPLTPLSGTRHARQLATQQHAEPTILT